MSMNEDRNIPATEINMANPVRPARMIRVEINASSRLVTIKTYMAQHPTWPGS